MLHNKRPDWQFWEDIIKVAKKHGLEETVG